MSKAELLNDLPEETLEQPSLSKKEIKSLRKEIKEKEATIVKTVRALEANKGKTAEPGFVEQLGDLIEGWKATAEEISADYLKLGKTDEVNSWSGKSHLMDRYLERLTSPDLAGQAAGVDQKFAINNISEIIDELCQALDHRVIPDPNEQEKVEPAPVVEKSVKKPEEKPKEFAKVGTKEDLFQEIEASGWGKRITNKVKKDVQDIIEWTTSEKFKKLNPKIDQQVKALEATFSDRFGHFEHASEAFKQDLFAVLEGLGVKTKLVQAEKPAEKPAVDPGTKPSEKPLNQAAKPETLKFKEVTTKAELFENIDSAGGITGNDYKPEEIKKRIDDIITECKAEKSTPAAVHKKIHEKLGDGIKSGFKNDLLTVLNAEGISTRREKKEAPKSIDFRGVASKEELFTRMKAEIPEGTLFKMPKVEGFPHSEKEVSCDTLVSMIEDSITHFSRPNFQNSSLELKKARAEVALSVIPDQYGLREAVIAVWKKMGLYEFDPTVRLKSGLAKPEAKKSGAPMKAEIIDLSSLPAEVIKYVTGAPTFEIFLRRFDYQMGSIGYTKELTKQRSVFEKAFADFQGPDFVQKTGADRTTAISKFVNRFNDLSFREYLTQLIDRMVPDPSLANALRPGDATVPEEPAKGLEVKVEALQKAEKKSRRAPIQAIPPVIDTFVPAPTILELTDNKAFVDFLVEYPDGMTLITAQNETELQRRYEIFQCRPKVIADLVAFSTEVVQGNFMFPLNEKLIGKGANMKESFKAFVNEEAIKNPEALLTLKAQIDQYKKNQFEIAKAQQELAELEPKDKLQKRIETYTTKRQQLQDALKTTEFLSGWGSLQGLQGIGLWVESWFVEEGKTKEDIAEKANARIAALPDGPRKAELVSVLEKRRDSEIAALEKFQNKRRIFDAQKAVKKEYGISFLSLFSREEKMHEQLKFVEKTIDGQTKNHQKVLALEALLEKTAADSKSLRVNLLSEVAPIKAVVELAQEQVHKLVTVFGQDDSVEELEGKLEYMTNLISQSAKGQESEVDPFAKFTENEDTGEAVRRLQLAVERRVSKEFVLALEKQLPTSEPRQNLEKALVGILDKTKIGLPEGEEKRKLLGKIFDDTIEALRKKKDPEFKQKHLYLTQIAINNHIKLKES